MSFQKLAVGDIVDVRFDGSATIGNDSYVMKNLTVTNTEKDIVTLRDEVEGEFDVYFFQNHWCYGSSAEAAELLRVS